MSKKKLKDSGVVIRVSNKVKSELKRRMGEEKLSFDALMRRILGLASRKGKKPEREIYWVLPKALEVAKTAAEARGKAVLAATKNGKRKAEKPVKVVKE